MGAIRDLWIKWKMLKLPWRRTFLVGQDLAGNTFWEFKDKLNSNRFRRIVRYRKRTHFDDVKMSPQWHQWLRHTRQEPPTLQEQHADLARLGQLKLLAQQADERWASIPSYLDKPKDQSQTAPEQNRRSEMKKQRCETGGFKSAVDVPNAKPSEENPWEKHKQTGGSRQSWLPEVWTPGVLKR